MTAAKSWNFHLRQLYCFWGWFIRHLRGQWRVGKEKFESAWILQGNTFYSVVWNLGYVLYPLFNTQKIKMRSERKLKLIINSWCAAPSFLLPFLNGTCSSPRSLQGFGHSVVAFFVTYLLLSLSVWVLSDRVGVMLSLFNSTARTTIQDHCWILKSANERFQHILTPILVRTPSHHILAHLLPPNIIFHNVVSNLNTQNTILTTEETQQRVRLH